MLIIFYLLVLFAKLNASTVFEINNYLTHYWPIENGQMLDVVGNAHMSPQTALQTPILVNDLNGLPNSALKFNRGYIEVPPSFYLNTPQITATFWIYHEPLINKARIIDLVDQNSFYNVILYILPDNYIYFEIYVFKIKKYDNYVAVISSSQWNFIAVTFDQFGFNTNVYLNGQLVQTYVNNFSKYATIHELIYIYLGKSNMADNQYSNTIMDDIRIYNISLSQSEILSIMQLNFHDKSNIHSLFLLEGT